jgi:CRP/FNR family cyclic AMP-dependent transcriptional regulator
MVKRKRIPPVVRVSYSKGDLIIKEGDYGISIYKIINGRVCIFKQSGGNRTHLAELGRGEVFGEMTFFNFLYEPRSASVTALEDVELEVWHPARLIEEYRSMPPLLKYVSRQMLNRLLRMNSIIHELTTKKRKREEKAKKPKPLHKRQHYRKKCNLTCHYRVAGSQSEEPLRGVIKDISPLGAGLEVPVSNPIHTNHHPGTEFELAFSVPPGSAVIARAKVRSVSESTEENQILMGLEFTNLTHHARRRIGFFVMP